MKIIKYPFPGSGRRASLPPSSSNKKKALLIGIQAVREGGRKELPVLKGPHRDVLDMKNLLMDFYQYDSKDITVLIDDDEPDHIQPTKENMIKKMRDLVDGARSGDRFFFHFSGHATQQDTDSPEEEDRKDELILSSDGQTIQDDDLKKLLVDPLPIGSTLVAVFDACHSGSLLDLKHFRCNRVYLPWLNKGRRKTDFPRNIIMRRNAIAEMPLRSVIQAKRLSQTAISWKKTSIDQVLTSPVSPSAGAFDFPPLKTKSKKSLSISTKIDTTEPWYGNNTSPIERCYSPVSLYCTGKCRCDTALFGDSDTASADVISLSSSKDGQRSWEDVKGSSMTQALIKVLRNEPHPCLRDLLTLISHDIHVFYLSLHESARRYKEEMKSYNAQKRQGKEPKKGKSVEMNNFQEPQLSSTQPLDMRRRWRL